MTAHRAVVALIAVVLLLDVGGCDRASLFSSGGSESKPEFGVVFNVDLFNIFHGRPAAKPIPPAPEPGSRPKPRVPAEEMGPER